MIVKIRNMKKNILTLIVPFLALVLFNNCENETSKPPDSNNDPESTFIVGIDNGLTKITIFDPAITIIALPHNSTYQTIDIDDDGIFDLEVHSEHLISPGGINFQKASFKVINPSYQVSFTEISDTIHRCMQLTGDSVISYTYYNDYSGISCQGDAIDTIYYNGIYSYPRIYNTGDTLTQTEFWTDTNEELIFSEKNTTSFVYLPPVTFYSIDNGYWNNQNLKYVLIRKEHNGRILYGWLKLRIDNYKEIRVVECALQK